MSHETKTLAQVFSDRDLKSSDYIPQLPNYLSILLRDAELLENGMCSFVLLLYVCALKSASNKYSSDSISAKSRQIVLNRIFLSTKDSSVTTNIILAKNE